MSIQVHQFPIFPILIDGKSLVISSYRSLWMGQSYFESSYLCRHHNFRVPLKGDTLIEKRRPSMTKKGIKSCSCWHMLNWAPKRAKIKWKAIEKALAAGGVSISKQSIQKHVSWAGKILLLVFWERSGKCTILLTTPSITPRGRVFQISLAWNTKFKARETRSLQTFLHFVTIYYSSKQEELCKQMPKSWNAVQNGFPSTSWDSHSWLFAAAFFKYNF